MDTTTAAQTAGVTVATIRTWCRRNVIAAIKTCGRWIIDATSLAYRIALSDRKEKRVELTTEAMVAIGGNRWQKAGKDRVYIDWTRFVGLEVNRYNTGNISYATLDGEKISNGEAHRLLTAVYKVYFDAADGKMHIQWGDSSPRTMDRDDLAKAIFGGIRTAIATL